MVGGGRKQQRRRRSVRVAAERTESNCNSTQCGMVMMPDRDQGGRVWARTHARAPVESIWRRSSGVSQSSSPRRRRHKRERRPGPASCGESGACGPAARAPPLPMMRKRTALQDSLTLCGESNPGADSAAASKLLVEATQAGGSAHKTGRNGVQFGSSAHDRRSTHTRAHVFSVD
jgi:hypothetical protein